MRKGILVLMQIIAAMAIIGLFNQVSGIGIDRNYKDAVPSMQSIATGSLAFAKNGGQWPDSILYRANTAGATIWFTTTGAYYQFTRSLESGDSINAPDSHFRGEGEMREEPIRKPDSLEIMMLKASLAGANPGATSYGEKKMSYKCNYFLGHNADKWRNDVPNYEAIVLKEVYPGIDLTYYGRGREMEYDFMVGAGADYMKIRIQYEGAEGLSVGNDGALIIKTKWGEVRELAPVVYQESGGNRRMVKGEYLIGVDNSFSFRLGAEYDRSLPVVIDPVLVYSTCLGGDDGDYAYSVAIDGSGAAYIAGLTYSADFPTMNPYQDTFLGYYDAFITKLSPSGDSLIYSTYFGGSLTDYGNAIAVDGSGQAYMTGWTESIDFPVKNAICGIFGGGAGDGYVVKLSSSGSSLIYSSYLGGSFDDYGNGIAANDSGMAYLTGYTWSYDFPIENAIIYSPPGPPDGFVTKIAASGEWLIYSTYLGGSHKDYPLSIAVDKSGCAYVEGRTRSVDFPTKNAYNANLSGYYDVFASKLSDDGDSLIYSTYIGGSDYDYGGKVAVDNAGCVYIAGDSYSSNYPVKNAYDSNYNGNSDIAVSKLSDKGDSLLFSTYLGGTDYDYPFAIAVDKAGRVHISGDTRSFDFPLADAFDSSFNGETDAYVATLSTQGDSLIFGSYLGGISNDYGNGIAADSIGNIYVTGMTVSADFPTLNPYRESQGGNYDAFVTKFSFADDTTVDVEDDHSKGQLPEGFELFQNYPNPFNPMTRIEYSVPFRSDISITIYNILGRKIGTLVDEIKAAGFYTVTWNGRDQSGKSVPSGIYFYRFKGGEYVANGKMLMLK